MSKIQAIRGMHDILPADSATWQLIEGVLRDTLNAYGYREIRVPLLEQTAKLDESAAAAAES